MKTNEQSCIDVTLAYEGGYSNHPADPGGATMNGVTQRVYDAYRQRKNQPPRDVRKLTSKEKFEIYDEQYWDRVNGDKLPLGVDLVVFDYAVNSGVSRASKDLQRTLGVAQVDGIIGAITLAAVEAADPDEIIEGLCARRLKFLKSLKTWKTFGKGWAARVAGIEARAYQMRDLDPLTVPEIQPTVGQAMESDTKVTKSPEAVGITTASLGAGGQALMSAANEIQPHMNESVFGRLALVAFIGLTIVGAVLIGWSYYKRLKEAGYAKT